MQFQMATKITNVECHYSSYSATNPQAALHSGYIGWYSVLPAYSGGYSAINVLQSQRKALSKAAARENGRSEREEEEDIRKEGRVEVREKREEEEEDTEKDRRGKGRVERVEKGKEEEDIRIFFQLAVIGGGREGRKGEGVNGKRLVCT